MNRVSIAVKLLPLVVGVLFFVVSCRNQPAAESTRSTIATSSSSSESAGPDRLLLGIDGADWRFVIPLMKQGKLPAIGKLVARGACGILMSRTMASPVEWTIIATGQIPEKTGITGFVVHDDRKGKRTVVSGNLRKVKAFWNILSEQAKSVAVIGWWATWPAESSIRGIMVSDLFPYRDTVKQTCSPPELESELDSVAASEQQRFSKILREDFAFEDSGTVANPTPSGDSGNSHFNPGLFLRDFRFDLEKAAYYRAIMNRRQRFDQAALFLNSTDIASHLFYRYTGSGSDVGEWPEDSAGLLRYGRIIEMAYRYAEKPLISALEVNSNLREIMIVSDHGFTAAPHQSKPRWNLLLEDLGLLRFRIDSEVKNFRSIDWESTLGFVDPRTSGESGFLQISLNLDIFKPGKQVFSEVKQPADALNLIRSKFEAISGLGGKKMFSFLSQDMTAGVIQFRIDPAVTHSAPGDSPTILVAGIAREVTRYFTPGHLSGGHRPEGIILLWGESFREACRIPAATTVQVTPTLLWLNGLPVSREMDGGVLTVCLTDRSLRINPVTMVDSFGPRIMKDQGTQLNDDVDTRIKTKLKALGYID
jgi:hypothetical protein